MLVFADATLADGRVRDVRVDQAAGTIDTVDTDLVGTDVATTDLDGTDVVDASGKRLLPGMLDAHVHFRQPGFPHKETWRTGSRSAAAGGVTTVLDQPNTDPPTVSGRAVEEKAELAADSLVDFGINGGVTPEWEPDSLLSAPITAVGEVFLADSTGEMGIDVEQFREAVALASDHGVSVTVHAEDATLFDEAELDGAGDGVGRDADADAWSRYRSPEAEAAAVETACEVATGQDAQLHIAHTSTPAGIDLADEAGLTCEVTPHHLFLSREDLEDLGTFGRMNPPLRSEDRRTDVMERVSDGTVDVIATDHAPHTRTEKQASIGDAPSGVPGVETALPLLLHEAREGRLSYERVRDLTAANPAAIFDLQHKGRIEPGRDADLVLVDPEDGRDIEGERCHSKCDWTPFEGWTGIFPELTMVRGVVAYERDDSEETFGDAAGENVAAR